MGLFDGIGQGGLMDMYSNPQTAGMMGLAQGLLAASAPSRIPVSMGQALGYGMQGGQQGFTNALGMQQNLLKMRAMQGLMGADGGGAPQGQPAPQQQPTSLLGVQANPSMGILSPTLPQTVAPQASAAPAAAGPTIFGKTPHELFQQGMLMNMAGIPGGGEMMKTAVEHDPTLALQMPTDMQRNAAAAYGYGSPEYLTAIRSNVDKEGTTPLRPGAPYIRNGQLYGTPPNAPAGYMNQPNGDGTWSVVKVNGGPDAVRDSASAQAGGQAEYKIEKVWDQSANGGRGGYVNQTVANVANAATPDQRAIVQTESNGNPNAVSPKGALGAWQVMPNTAANPGYGVTPARDNSPAELDRVGRDYYGAMTQRYGSPTLGAIAYNMGPPATDNWLRSGGQWEKLPQETRNYVGKVSTLTALNSGAGSAQRGGPMAAEPPLGQTNAANASQGAPSAQMQKDYEAMAAAGPQSQQSLEYLDHMLQLAQNKPGYMGMGVGGIPGMTRLSTDAAEYEKARASYISAQGKALGSSGTDASRATIEESVPEYGKPQDAMLRGLNDQRNQLQLGMLRRQFLEPTYRSGSEKAYAQQSAAFDNVVKPSMMTTVGPIMGLPPDQQRPAVRAAVNDNPSLRPVFEMLFNNGLLK